jgi:hypothetical protein
MLMGKDISVYVGRFLIGLASFAWLSWLLWLFIPLDWTLPSWLARSDLMALACYSSWLSGGTSLWASVRTRRWRSYLAAIVSIPLAIIVLRQVLAAWDWS